MYSPVTHSEHVLPRQKPVVEHVWSRNRNSKIFEDIFGYFQSFSQTTQHVSSFDPKRPKPDFRLYHRPHLEDSVQSPCASVVHHDLQDVTSDFDIASTLPIYQRCDRIFCLNLTQAKQLKALGLNQTCVIPHGYHPDLLKVRAVREKKSKTHLPPWTIGLFSRRYPSLVKGEAFLYELLNHLPPQHFKFLLIGQDRDKDATFMRRFGFDAIHETVKNYDELIQAYTSLDALLVLSISEGGPACVPESLAAAVPILARPVGMIPDVSQNFGTVLTLTDNPVRDAQSIIAFLSTERNQGILSEPLPHNIIPWADVIAQYEKEILTCLSGSKGSVTR